MKNKKKKKKKKKVIEEEGKRRKKCTKNVVMIISIILTYSYSPECIRLSASQPRVPHYSSLLIGTFPHISEDPLLGLNHPEIIESEKKFRVR